MKIVMDVIKATVEVIGRRSAEQVLFRVFYGTPQSSFGDLMQWFPAPGATK